METFGDTLWIGPGLNRTIDNSANWYFPENAQKIINEEGSVYSLALAQDTVWAGLGYTASTPNGDVQSGLGFHYSTDGGENWKFIKNPNDEEDDSTFVYGGTRYAKLPVTAQQQSPSFEVAFKGETVFSANWALGLVRSQDFGANWKRIILPPQQVDTLSPDNEYTFNSNGTNRYDPRFDQNLLGFSVFIDRSNRVWCGTAGGLNISDNALTAPADSIRWRHIQVDGSSDGLLGNWIITIKQQPSTGDIWMTNWSSGLRDNESFGIVRTRNGGKSFDRYLQGKRINDIDFSDGVIYAAGDDGLFKSSDGGANWTTIPQITSANTFIKKSAAYYSIASTTNRLWVGTGDGIASTADGGENWEITRVNFPLDGNNHYQQDAPDVNAYAYPNPFSPRRHSLVRIKYEVKKAGQVTIRLFDFRMKLIKKIASGDYTPGTYEAVWDGTTTNGKDVANGAVFYQIDSPGNTIRGKILLIN
ncbi:FlgD immunoglobulin-like domain containing protein [Fodinibius saliphilus]|uniref:FlgD immunoglobulin-like domain containing protein n=1 Tax=Fodinibius saliphilus TaxID=1920650 RepID=UPI001FE8BC7A|nr:FlgD immunoglobulin-like domain containing protein [Fodinibius saliphilus]